MHIAYCTHWSKESRVQISEIDTCTMHTVAMCFGLIYQVKMLHYSCSLHTVLHQLEKQNQTGFNVGSLNARQQYMHLGFVQFCLTILERMLDISVCVVFLKPSCFRWLCENHCIENRCMEMWLHTYSNTCKRHERRIHTHMHRTMVRQTFRTIDTCSMQ